MAQTKAQLLGPVVGDVVMDVSTLSLDAEGNKVGIGHTEPDLTLHVNGVDGLPSSSGSTPTGHLTIRNKATSTKGMFLGVSDASPFGSWIQAQDSANNATNYPLLLNPNGGNVGIGTNNPLDKLSIHTAPNALVFGAKDTTRGNHIFQLLANNPAGDGELRLYKSSATGTHEKTVEIKSTGNSYFNGGNFGVGTDNPQRKLVVSDAGTEGLEFFPGDSVNGSTINAYNRTTSSFTPFSLNALDYRFSPNGGTEAVRIDSSGRMLLGTTTEGEGNADDFTIATSAHTGMTIRSGTANRGNIYFSDGTSGDAEYRGYVTYDHDGDKFKFGTANADRLVILGDGEVECKGGAAGQNALLVTGNYSSGNNVDIQTWQRTGGAVQAKIGYKDVDTSMFFGTDTAHSLTIMTGGTEKLRITSAGDTTLGYAGTSLHFYNGFNNSTARIQNGGGSNSSELKFLVKNAGTESEKMRLTSAAGLAIVTAGSMPSNAGNETLYLQGEGHNGHGTGNSRSVVSIVGALSSNNSGIGIWIGARTNENTAVIGTRTANGNLAFETYSGGWGERMRLLNTGQLVIGGTANIAHPNMDDLIIGDANGNRGLTICSGTGAFGSVCFGDSADGSGNDRYEGYVEYYHNDNSLRLGTSHTEKIHISSTGDMRLGASSYGDPKTKLDIIEDQTIPFSVTANTGTFVGVMVRTRYYLEFSVEFPQHATNTSIQLRFNRTSNAPSISIDYYSGGGYQIDHGVTGVAYISFYAASGNTLYTGTNHQSAYGGATPSWSHSGGTSEVLFKLSNIAYSNGSMCHFRINMPRGGINNVTVDRTTP